jgi:hypothetical protein
MAYTIHFEHDFVGAEELQLLKTKQAILEKLRVRFGEKPNLHARTGTQTKAASGLPSARAEKPR